MNNKKGLMSMGIIIAIVGVVVLALVLFSTGVLGTNFDIPSETPQVDGYNKKDCPDKGLKVSGFVNIEDSATFFDIEPSIEGIDVSQVKVDGKLLKFGQEAFTYEVSAFDVETNSQLGITQKGTAILKSKDNEGIDVPYSLVFKLPDNDCNGKLDDFSMKIVAKLKGEDIGDVEEFERLLTFEGGSIK